MATARAPLLVSISPLAATEYPTYRPLQFTCHFALVVTDRLGSDGCRTFAFLPSLPLVLCPFASPSCLYHMLPPNDRTRALSCAAHHLTLQSSTTVALTHRPPTRRRLHSLRATSPPHLPSSAISPLISPCPMHCDFRCEAKCGPFACC
jgi:hypothetical protein